MSLRVGETGKIIRVSSGGYDMSSYTELTLNFTKPDGTTISKVTADGVTIGSGVTDPDLGVLAANEYVEYPIETSFLDQSGIWAVSLTYTNTASTPDDIYIGACVQFTVSSATCTV